MKRRAVMPLSKIQTDILRLLASHRDPESYVAGATPLNRDAPRRYFANISISVICETMCPIRMCDSWTRGVWSEGTQRQYFETS